MYPKNFAKVVGVSSNFGAPAKQVKILQLILSF